MARHQTEVRKFGQYDTTKLLFELGRSGAAYTIDSDYVGTGYAVKQDTLIIMGGKNGAFSVALSEARKFAEELMGVIDICEERKEKKLRVPALPE